MKRVIFDTYKQFHLGINFYSTSSIQVLPNMISGDLVNVKVKIEVALPTAKMHCVT